MQSVLSMGHAWSISIFVFPIAHFISRLLFEHTNKFLCKKVIFFFISTFICLCIVIYYPPVIEICDQSDPSSDACVRLEGIASGASHIGQGLSAIALMFAYILSFWLFLGGAKSKDQRMVR